MTATTGLEDLTRTQLEDALLWLRAYNRADYAQALYYARSRMPEGHGQNHIDNAGHVIFAGGDCITCGATVDHDGNVTPAQVAS